VRALDELDHHGEVRRLLGRGTPVGEEASLNLCSPTRKSPFSLLQPDTLKMAG
jgi:hypothetical protein